MEYEVLTKATENPTPLNTVGVAWQQKQNARATPVAHATTVGLKKEQENDIAYYLIIFHS